MRTIIHSEPAESGLAAMAMVARAHGLHMELAELRRRFPLSSRGARLDYLIHVAQQLGFAARPVRLDIDELGKLTLPCILHWDINQYVVLTKVGRAGITVVDPTAGRLRVSHADVSSHFCGAALELAPAADFSPRAAVASVELRQLVGPVSGLWPMLVQLLSLSLALQLFVLAAPLLMQWVVDQVLVAADRDLLVVLGLGFGLALLLQAGVGLLRGMAAVYLASRLGVRWAGNVFAHLLKLPLEFFGKRSLSDVHSRLSSLRGIQESLGTGFIEALLDAATATLTLALMLLYNWKLAVMTVMVTAVYALARLLLHSPLREGMAQQLAARGRLQGYVLETLRGIQSLKVAGEESRRRAGHDNLLVGMLNREVRLAHMHLGIGGVGQLLFGIERVAVIWLGALLVLDSVFSLGMLVAYLIYRELFVRGVRGLVDGLCELRLLRLHGERLAGIVMDAPEQSGPAEAMVPVEARIEVRNLRFRYAESEPWVLDGCSFSIAPGETVAIVGASGCGKSTLVKLMLGLLPPAGGSIRVGGHELSALGARNLRAMVGAVMQDDQLFSGSIADNISFFDPEFDMARVEVAARLAAVHQDIIAMPLGYHGLVGDMGSALSGGQKHGVLLARALYRQPKLLFLDEATSHLDVMHEQRVNAAIRQLRLTKLIIAHRPETIAGADRVLVMEHGRIVGELRPPGDPAPYTPAGLMPLPL